MRDAEAVTFAGGRIDRASRLRGDAAAQAALAADPRARGLALWRGRPLVAAGEGLALAWRGLDDPLFRAGREPRVFLGLDDDIPCFACEIDDWDPDAAPVEGFGAVALVPHPDLAAGLGFADLRANMAALDAAEAGTAAAAKGILGWHQSHGFCANCGGRSEVADAGWRRVCPACGAQHFPRTDPVVIMLILSGNSVLLGRSPGWPEGMYSLLAGFMEPGESIEAAVRREVAEETGVPVGPVDYLSSQPWPFPSSLMIGCRGLATGREITLDPAELEDARWVSREGLAEAIAGRDPGLRPARAGSIARFLLDHWLADTLD
ncbi:MAG: NAD(+) diphosphatase [Amaricoccus sp.]|uniref:NAD(+) diphosphatase n=1 Tax=Amaricoccus sp. TaxID=1872485 RepID=UPI0039E6E695